MAGKHPEYLWWKGEQRRWDDANVHISELGWSTVGAVFEGIRAYWSEAHGELYVYRLREHLERLHRSMRLVRLPIDYSLDELTDAIVALLRANETREDTYVYPSPTPTTLTPPASISSVRRRVSSSTPRPSRPTSAAA